MDNKNYSIIISTCDKFSDLWDANVSLLEKNWGDRGVETYFVTDKPSNRQFENVKIIAAGEGAEITERIKTALKIIKTDYMVFLLDDYFLIDPINSEKIEDYIRIMQKEKIDYLRLYTFLNAKYNNVKFGDYDDIYRIATNARYNINLYPCVFSRDFLRETVSGDIKNAWQYEVGLTKIAAEYGANCAVVRPDALNMLDVVRKGKLIRKAKRYLDKNGLYNGDRPVLDIYTTVKLGTIYKLKSLLPRSVSSFIRKFLKKCGKKFYSDEYED